MRRLVTVLVLVVLLAGVADRLAWYVAQRRLAAQIRSSAQLTAEPSVRISGFPFLTQAVRGRYDRIGVRARSLPAGAGLRVDSLDVELRGLHVPLGQVLRGDVQAATVDGATAAGEVPFAELDAAAAARLGPRLAVRFGRAAADRVAFTGTYRGVLREVPIRGQARLSLAGGSLAVDVLAGSLAGVPAEVRRQVVNLLSASYRLPALPYGLRPTAVVVAAGGIMLTASGRHVTLRSAG